MSVSKFQSSPGFEAGRYSIKRVCIERLGKLFQSSPGFEAGRYPRYMSVGVLQQFQSSPGFEAGRYL